MRRVPRRMIAEFAACIGLALGVTIAYSFLTRPMDRAPGGEIDARLERLVTLARPKQVEISEALQLIGDLAGVEIQVDLDPETLRNRRQGYLVQLELEDVPVRAALDKVVRQLGSGAQWRIEGNRIRVTPPASAVVTVPMGARTAARAAAKQEEAERLLRIYNVQDLLDEYVRWRWKNPEPGVTATAAALEAEARDRLWRVASGEMIAPGNGTNLIMVAPRLVAPVAPGRMMPVSVWGRFLVVRQNAEGHRRIEDLLAILRQR